LRKNYLEYLEYYKEFKVAPCLYCPGNCVLECPTFRKMKSNMYNPLGYVRIKKYAIEYCLECWRCTFNCPLEYPLPIYIENLKGNLVSKISIETVIEGERYLIGEPEYVDDMIIFARKIRLGVKSIEIFRGREGKTDFEVQDNLIGYTPEISFILGIPHYSEVLNKLIRKLNLEIKLHIPCLLIRKSSKIMSSLESMGIKIIDINMKDCLRLYNKKLYDYTSLCPKALEYNINTLDKIIIQYI